MEEWKDIPGHEGYQASSLGQIRSVYRNIKIVKLGEDTERKYKGRVLKQCIETRPDCDYKRWIINMNGKTRRVAVLVSLAFHPLVEGKPTVDHINADPLDNRIDNLRWADTSEQSSNRPNAPLASSGHRHIHKDGNGYSYVKTVRGIRHRKYFGILEEAIAYRDTLI